MADYAIHDTTLIGTSNIIRKKEGSSALIDPADYPKRINLMGMLEEKTIVSSPIADFSDGADDVPTKSLVVTIPSTLSGVSSVSETQTGRNICSVAPWVRDTTFYGSNWTEMVAFLNTLPVGNYSVSYDYEITALIGSSIDVAYSPYIRALVNGSYVNVTAYSAPQTDSSPTVGKIYHCSASFSITSQTVGNIANFYLYCGQSGIKVAEVTVKNAMVELGSTVSTYEPYNPTTYTASLGRTIYGGTVDVVNGTGTETYGYIVFDGSEDENWSDYSNYEGYSIYISTMKTGTRQYGVCNQLTNSSSSAQGQTNAFWLGVNTKRFYVIGVYQSMGNTLEAFKTYLASNPLILVYPLATPEDFTFDGQEVPTRLGYNAFWSDEGDTEVTYRASGTIYQYPSGEEASF